MTDEQITALGTYTVAEIPGYLSQTNYCVCSDSWLWIHLQFGEMFEQLIVDDSLAQLGHNQKNRLDSLFSDDGNSVCKSGCLVTPNINTKA